MLEPSQYESLTWWILLIAPQAFARSQSSVEECEGELVWQMEVIEGDFFLKAKG
ncbi:MAG: hypothetical protein H0T95_10170 [Chthoniobacterales bacterium]|jgi:hypothetical protein|nr:hypothetical protein [Chthoniobacterales bacterium]